MVWLRAEQSGCLSVPVFSPISWGETKRRAPKFPAFGARSPELVLLEAMDVTTASLEKAGPCRGLPQQLVVTGSPELLWGLTAAAPEHHFQEG